MTFTFKHTKYACYLGYVTQATVNNLPPLLFSAFVRDLGIQAEMIGLLIAINFGTQILVDLFGAKYADKIGYKPLLAAAHLFSAAGMLAFSFLPFMLPPFAGLAGAIILTAVGGGLIEVLISPVIEAIPAEESKRAAEMSLLHSFYCWGHMAVVLLSTLYFVSAGAENWRFLPPLWAALPLFTCFLFLNVPVRNLNEKQDPGAGTGGKNAWAGRSMFRTSAFWILMGMMFFSAASEQGMSQWASFFAETGLKISKTAGDILGPCAFAFLMGLSRLLFAKRAGAGNLDITLFSAGLGCAASYLTASFAPHPLLALAGCAGCGFFSGVMWPGTFSKGAVIFPAGGTKMFGLFAFAGDIGCGAGPALLGYISGFMERSLAGAMGLAVFFPLALSASVAALVLRERHKLKKNASLTFRPRNLYYPEKG